ncbi:MULTISPECIES: hypothetical protein [Pedobacter]|uniref:Uncharacterized protein n=1 Tax=Pedobacter heparinus (strain ATCC 13125 / DSM 2366 / CIP 104194 / JCM 7457 / NBRC 12017 / NCIMB 9290 / NRRL B-14731 / HIM 762-3) TaxID=485917 RepID=C6XSH9_PEDHD|nr:MULTISPECIES: hypothetical protein [Pedobacter]ACU03524.1 hypothetical protein Phep_1309 [Pedobacter heparinus DSM 2366]MBB5438992.1 hypothetical protein [Pedobacter sp. AK017]
MDSAFNIRIGYGKKEVTVTILPVKENYYKVIYYGGVMGAVYYNGDEWELIEKEDVEPGDLPLYEPELIGERLEIILNETTVDAIGDEIELYFREETG